MLWQTLSPTYSFVNTVQVASIPSSYISIWDVKTPSLCSLAIGGIPTVNVPALSLTTTTTITIQEDPTTVDSLQASIDTSSASSQAFQEASPSSMVTVPAKLTQPPDRPTLAPSVPVPPIDSHITTLAALSIPAASGPEEPPLSEEPQPKAGAGKKTYADSPGDGTTKVPALSTGELQKSISTHPQENPAKPKESEIGSHDDTSRQAPAPGLAIAGSSNGDLDEAPNLATITKGSTISAAIGDITSPPNSLYSFPQFITIDGKIATRNSASQYILGTQTLKAGVGILVDGTPVSLQPSADTLVVGSRTMPFAVSPTDDIIAVGGFTFTRGSGSGSGSDLIVGFQTLTPGAAVTISGTPISLAALGTAVIVGSSTTPLETSRAPDPVTLDGFTFTPGPGSDLVVASQTITPGAAAIIPGTSISLAISGAGVVDGGSTFQLPGPTTRPVVLDINGNSFTEVSGSDFPIGSQTIVPGGSAITVNGTALSLAPGATGLAIGSSMEALTTSQGLGEIILGGFSSGGPGAPNANSTSGIANSTSGALWLVKHRFGLILRGAILIWIAAYCF
ncbi:MAG: hypothetical protein Q9166_006799 [cf. Caloplaca sp. 2 TL-2023]